MRTFPATKLTYLTIRVSTGFGNAIAQRLPGISENITPHSGRVGGAVSLAEDGASLPELQLAGGWQSPEMPGHYTKQANVKRGGMAKLSAKRKR